MYNVLTNKLCARPRTPPAAHNNNPKISPHCNLKPRTFSVALPIYNYQSLRLFPGIPSLSAGPADSLVTLSIYFLLTATGGLRHTTHNSTPRVKKKEN